MNFFQALASIALFSFFFSTPIAPEEPWGKGSSIAFDSNNKSHSPMKSEVGKIFESIISFHANVISPVDGPRSHYRPTSSRYMLLAMRKNGILKGFFQGCDRLLRENNEKWLYRTVIIDGIEYKYDPIP